MAGTTSWNPCPRCSTAASMIFHAEWDAEAQRSYPVPCPESDPTPRAPGGTREEPTTAEQASAGGNWFSAEYVARLQSRLATLAADRDRMAAELEDVEARREAAVKWIASVTLDLIDAGGQSGDRTVARENLRALIRDRDRMADALREIVKALAARYETELAALARAALSPAPSPAPTTETDR